MATNDDSPDIDFGERSDCGNNAPGQVRTIDLDQNNKAFYVWLLAILGLTVISTVIGSMVLAYHNKSIPNAVVAIGSVAVGALGSLFTHNR